MVHFATGDANLATVKLIKTYILVLVKLFNIHILYYHNYWPIRLL